MYKLLIATDKPEVRAVSDAIDWKRLGFRTPIIASTPAEAVEVLSGKAIDAVAFTFVGMPVTPLRDYLHVERPSLPIFTLVEDTDKQAVILSELRHVLNRIHADYADIPYDEDTMRSAMRDELVHRLLCGEIEDFSLVERELQLIRGHISATRPCVVYEMDMPQGDVYMLQHASAIERLESALRNNFFGRYIDHIYYAVAVLTPRQIRVAAIPEAGLDQDLDDFGKRADAHIRQSLNMIKEYLNLDINIAESGFIRNLKAFTEDETTEGGE